PPQAARPPAASSGRSGPGSASKLVPGPARPASTGNCFGSKSGAAQKGWPHLEGFMKAIVTARQCRQRRPNGGRPPRARPIVEWLEDRIVPAGNPIVTENLQPGTANWGVSGAGDPTIQGFATDISVNHGQTVNFKINDTANVAYHVDIFRMGYYQGNGARLVATIPSSQTLRQVQPTPLSNAA